MAITYTPDKPGVYSSTVVYDRLVDGDPQISIKIVPAVNSLIIFPTGVVKRVTSVDNDYNSGTYLAITYGDILTSLPDPTGELINYGKDCLMLYYDKRQTPTRIRVDKKLDLRGENTIGYRIIRTTPEGERLVISSQLNNEGEVVSDIIPVLDTGVDHALTWTSGYTLFSIDAGEIVQLELVDSAGIVTMEAMLLTKEATILNTLQLSSNPITGFDADCSQIRDDYWVIYVGQDIDELSIFPFITFADGTNRHITIDNLSAFMYGYEEIDSSFPGNACEVVIKYYLGHDELSTISQEVDGTRFVTMTKDIVIDSLEKYNYTKISVIPIWNSGTSRYSLRYVGYHETRRSLTNVTSLVTYVTGFNFNATLYNTQQEIRITVPYTNQAGATVQFNQTFWITLTAPGQPEPFLIRSLIDGIGYGAENALYDRPVIMYDATLEQYFIPTPVFTSSTEFLHNFYYAASPPWLTSSEIEPPVPTHFTVRDSVSLRPLLTLPVAVGDYEEVMTFISLTTPNAFVNSTVLVEWLLEINGEYNLLYSVPVEVFLSDTGYLG